MRFYLTDRRFGDNFRTMIFYYENSIDFLEGRDLFNSALRENTWVNKRLREMEDAKFFASMFITENNKIVGYSNLLFIKNNNIKSVNISSINVKNNGDAAQLIKAITDFSACAGYESINALPLEEFKEIYAQQNFEDDTVLLTRHLS